MRYNQYVMKVLNARLIFRKQYVLPSIIFFLAATIGLVVLFAVRAAPKNLEAEAGSRSGNVVAISDSSASGSSGVRFMAGSVPPSGELMGWEINPTNV